MAVKIKLKRMGKIRTPQYRVIVADSRTRRDGRAIEEIGKYHPKEDPSLVQIDSERAQYWLGVGAQPTEPVLTLLKITGDWQKFKGLPGADGTLKVKDTKAKKSELFNAALAEVQGDRSDATTPRKRAAKKSAAKKAASTEDAAKKTTEKSAKKSAAKAATTGPTADAVEEKATAISADAKAADQPADAVDPATEAAESGSES